LIPLGFGGAADLGDATVLRTIRLLRLTRMTRMARLLRCFPELFILVKGMVAAMRSVFFTLLLLFGITFVFAIGFVQYCKGTTVGETYFANVPSAILTLLLRGTLLDDITSIVMEICAESWIASVGFFTFILVASMTVLNMLIGVLCEVVNLVADVEREELLVTFVRNQLASLVEAEDDDDDFDRISKAEFHAILSSPEGIDALKQVGVDPLGLVDMADSFFQSDEGDEEAAISFGEFMEEVLQLRGQNVSTVKDVVNLRSTLKSQMASNNDEVLEAIERLSRRLATVEKACVGHSSTGHMPATSKSKGKELTQDLESEIFQKLAELQGLMGRLESQKDMEKGSALRLAGVPMPPGFQSNLHAPRHAAASLPGFNGDDAF